MPSSESKERMMLFLNAQKDKQEVMHLKVCVSRLRYSHFFFI
jgi:hypothetical protein